MRCSRLVGSWPSVAGVKGPAPHLLLSLRSHTASTANQTAVSPWSKTSRLSGQHQPAVAGPAIIGVTGTLGSIRADQFRIPRSQTTDPPVQTRHRVE